MGAVRPAGLLPEQIYRAFHSATVYDLSEYGFYQMYHWGIYAEKRRLDPKSRTKNLTFLPYFSKLQAAMRE